MDRLQSFLNNLLINLPDWAARVGLAILVLLLIYVLRRLLLRTVEHHLHRLLQQLGWPQIEAIVDSLMLPLRLLVIAGALLLSVEILTPDRETLTFVNNLTRSLVIVSGFIALFRLVDILALDSQRLSYLIGLNLEARLLPLIRTIVKLILFSVAVIIVMQEWSVDVSGLIASLGIVGLAFSLAAQDTVSNLFGFSTIIGDRTFFVGEFIRSDTVEGIVESVGMRSTRIRKPDRGLITVPNTLLANAPVQRFIRRRIEFTLGVTYATTAAQMETLLGRLREMLKKREAILDETVAVYFTGFGTNSLDIIVFCDVTIRDWRMLYEEREQVNLAVMRIVAELGLSIAFPTRSVYIEQMPDNRDSMLPINDEPKS